MWKTGSNKDWFTVLLLTVSSEDLRQKSEVTNSLVIVGRFRKENYFEKNERKKKSRGPEWHAILQLKIDWFCLLRNTSSRGKLILNEIFQNLLITLILRE